MVQNAALTGAKAVVMMRFDSGDIAEGVAYRAAAILDPAPQ
jgi:uncharacterized protein YbjQ (UPF0145 family)